MDTKQFDTKKFEAWVEVQGGWTNVINGARRSPFYTSYIDLDSCLEIENYNPFKSNLQRDLWLLLPLNINDFIKNDKTSDPRTALKVLGSGGVIRIFQGTDYMYLKMESVQGTLKMLWSRTGLFDSSQCQYNRLLIEDFEVISWGDYNHE